MLSLIQKAEEAVDAGERLSASKQKIGRVASPRTSAISCARALKKMGPLNILGMLPGMGNLKQLAEHKPDERQLRRVEAIIGSMTP